MKNKLKQLWELYYTFVKIGGFTLGGGYAMIPIIQREAVDVKKWAGEEETVDMITLAQSMPGVIGINTATALGTKVAGIPGAISATLGMVTPSIVVIILIAMVFDEFQKITVVQHAFFGIRAAIAALMFSAVVRLFKTSVKDVLQIILFVLALVCMVFLKIGAQYVLMASAAVTICYVWIKTAVKGGGKA